MSGFGEVARRFGPTVLATASANAALIIGPGHGHVPEIDWTNEYTHVNERVVGVGDWEFVGVDRRSTIIPGSESTTDLPIAETPAGGTGAPGEDDRWNQTVGAIRELAGRASGPVVVDIMVNTPAGSEADRASANSLEQDAKDRSAYYPETLIVGADENSKIPEGTVRVRIWAYDEEETNVCSQNVTIERDITTGEEDESFPYLIPLVPMFPLPRGRNKPGKQSSQKAVAAEPALQPRTSEAGPEPGRDWSPRAKAILGLGEGTPSRRPAVAPRTPVVTRVRRPSGHDRNANLGWIPVLALAAFSVAGAAVVYKEMPIEGDGPCKTAGEWAIHWCSSPGNQAQDPTNPNGGSIQPDGGDGTGSGPGESGGDPKPEVCPPESRTTQNVTVVTRTNGVETGRETGTVHN